ncbi:hypothetical protein [Actinopolymorpha alba]|uniref:hypothetical protein n=1 Tax=Actinopolymorpha alba TaxID=533267 RepID=UPI00036D9C94|nr:hypothetical protein [Actinopolymorpha alba]
MSSTADPLLQQAIGAGGPTAAMLRVASAALRDQSVSYLRGGGLRTRAVLASGALPEKLRREAYAVLGGRTGLPPDRLAELDLEAAARWVVGHYDHRRYPGVVIGSANGAALHVCAAAGVPWLPQTLPVTVRWPGNDPDRPDRAMEFGARTAAPLLDRHPDIELHHLHDPNHDRLRTSQALSLRLKWTSLPAAYAMFLADCLAPGAPIVLLEDTSTWPTTRVAERHVFQTGTPGGIAAEEYLRGSERVAAFLRAQGSTLTAFAVPEPDGTSPEAEWGFDPGLAEALTRWTSRTGQELIRLRTPSPQALAEPVAAQLRDSLRKAGAPGDRLLVESSVLLDPVAAARSGSVAYWTLLGVEPARQAVARHLEAAAAAGAPYHDVDVLLFPNGVASVGATPPRAWAGLAEHVTGTIRFLAGTERGWPAHFDTLARYDAALRGLPGVLPATPPLDLRMTLRCLGAVEAYWAGDRALSNHRSGSQGISRWRPGWSQFDARW